MGQGNFKHRYTPCIDLHEQRRSFPRIPQFAVNSLRWVDTLSCQGDWVLRLARISPKQYVFVKVLNKAYLLRTKQIMHAYNERDMLVKMLGDPFIVQCVGTAQDLRNLYCLMEFVQGGDLFSRIYSEERLHPSHARFYLAEVVIAISHIHRIGYIYRDLKSENVLISSTGHVKLWNFGLSKFLKNSEKAYTICGTPEYIAPEVLIGCGYNSSVDWWQVGILLYEMLAGCTPFIDSDPFSLYRRVLTKPAEFPLGVFPPAAESLISSLLSKDPCQRPHSQDVMRHPFFQGLDWDNAAALIPPFIPDLSEIEDVQYFDEGEEPQDAEKLAKRWQQMLFDGY